MASAVFGVIPAGLIGEGRHNISLAQSNAEQKERTSVLLTDEDITTLLQQAKKDIDNTIKTVVVIIRDNRYSDETRFQLILFLQDVFLGETHFIWQENHGPQVGYISIPPSPAVRKAVWDAVLDLLNTDDEFINRMLNSIITLYDSSTAR